MPSPSKNAGFQAFFDSLVSIKDLERCGKADPTGQDRGGRDRGKPLAGKSTLNRLELTPVGADADRRYQKIVARHGELEQSFVEIFIEQHATPPREIVLDLDATDGPVHGHQLGRFFQGYYREYCFLPLSIFCGHSPLCAKRRPADIQPNQPVSPMALTLDSHPWHGFCAKNLISFERSPIGMEASRRGSSWVVVSAARGGV